MGVIQKIIEDCEKILRCHMDKTAPDWELFVRQVNAMDRKYRKYGIDAYKYMQKCIKTVFQALQMIEGAGYETTCKS